VGCGRNRTAVLFSRRRKSSRLPDELRKAFGRGRTPGRLPDELQ